MPAHRHDAVSRHALPIPLWSLSARGRQRRHAGPAALALVLALIVLATSLSTNAATLSLSASDGETALEHVVFSLHSDAASRAAQAGKANMDQIDSQFAPRVLAVPVGTSILFPNRDNTRHHVYSFSPAKRFELPLYGGIPAEAVVFDVPGVVTLGCNIHDWMIGYILVLDTPYQAVSDAAGSARIEAPAGSYRLRVWHERLQPGTEPEERELVLEEGASTALDVVLTIAPPPPPRGDERLRALQERFRSLKRDPP